MSKFNALYIPTLCSGVTYWRMYNFVNAAINNGTYGAHLLWWQKECHEIHPWQEKLATREHFASILGEMEAAVRCADVVIMGMVHGETGLNLMRAIREMHNKPVVVEMDDNILSTPTYNPAANFYSPDSFLRLAAVKQMKEADAVIVTTPHLKETYHDFNKHIYQMPNCLDLDFWKVQKKSEKGKIIVGWAGGASHNEDLDIIVPAVKYFAKEYPKLVEFKIVHGISPKLKDMPNVKWVSKFAEIMDYPKHIARQGFDIALAPLVDNNFNRSKSNLRWLEAAAFNVPCVASRVGHFEQTITDGVDGLLCDDANDFIENIEKLVNDKKLRRAIGTQANITARTNFNVDTITYNYRDALAEIIERGQVKTSESVKESNFKQEAEVI